MAKGGMTKIMTQGNGFGKHFVELKSPGHSSGDLRNFQGMREAGSVMITRRRQKHLCLVLKPPEGLCVNNPVPIPLKSRSNLTRFLRDNSTFCLTTQCRKRRKGSSLQFFKALPNRHERTL
jgi:hypothetical protein